MPCSVKNLRPSHPSWGFHCLQLPHRTAYRVFLHPPMCCVLLTGILLLQGKASSPHLSIRRPRPSQDCRALYKEWNSTAKLGWEAAKSVLSPTVHRPGVGGKVPGLYIIYPLKNTVPRPLLLSAAGLPAFHVLLLFSLLFLRSTCDPPHPKES